MRTRRIFAVLLAAIALTAAACSSGDTAPTTTTLPELEFGRGEVPASVPETFPIPDAAVIGATMIDGTRGLTEMVITYPADVPDVVDYYEKNLPALGYTIDRSEGTDGAWEIDLTGETVTGEIALKVGGSGLTAGTVRLTHS